MAQMISIYCKKRTSGDPVGCCGDDGFNDNAQAIADNVLKNVQDDSIIVMHMNGYPNDPKTSNALPNIKTLKHVIYICLQ